MTVAAAQPPVYRAMRLDDLARFLGATCEDGHRWRLVAEFLEEFRHEPPEARVELLREEPTSTSDERWDVFLAALAEHLAGQDGRGAAAWAATRCLSTFWFPFNTAAARVDAIVHGPVAFRRRGIFVAPGELGVA